MRAREAESGNSGMHVSRTRAPWIMWIILAVATAIVFWAVNASLLKPAADDPGRLRAFLGNLYVFSVAVTSASVAGVAWAGYGLGCPPGWMLAAPLLVGLAGLACGLGISWGAGAPVTGSSRGLLVANLRLAGLLGVGFALVGATVSDLSVRLARRIPGSPTRNGALLDGLVIVALNSLWGAAAVLAIGLARAQMLRP